jgi:hypothetical protein
MATATTEPVRLPQASIGSLIKTGKPGGSTCVTASKCRQLGQARGANRDGDRLSGVPSRGIASPP